MIEILDKLFRRTVARRMPGSYEAYVLASRVVSAYENRNVQIDVNGESWFQHTLAKRGLACAVDVGANKGEWAEGILRVAPGCRLICYEPIEATFAMLRENIDESAATLVCAALSDTPGTLEIQAVPDRPELASAHADYTGEENVMMVTLDARTGDAEMARLDVPHIDVLKVDAEGHDLAVMQGLQETVAADRIDFIQFEYNYATLAAGKSLKDFFDLLADRYLICRLLPAGLEATGYHHSLDNFGQSNWICIRRALIDSRLITQFSIKRARGLAGDLMTKQAPQNDAAEQLLER